MLAPPRAVALRQKLQEQKSTNALPAPYTDPTVPAETTTTTEENTTGGGGALITIQSLPPGDRPLAEIVNARKLQGQRKHFKCPDWVVIPPRGYFFEVRKMGEKPQRLNVDLTPYYLFGRDGAADFKLDHRSISRIHFAFLHASDGFMYVIDLKSAIGTCLNDQKLEKLVYTRIAVGDTIKVGESSRRYVLKRDRVWAAAASAVKVLKDGTTVQTFTRVRKPGEDVAGVGADVVEEFEDDDSPATKKRKIQESGKDPEEKIRCLHMLVKHRGSSDPFDNHGLVVTRSPEMAHERAKGLRNLVLATARDKAQPGKKGYGDALVAAFQSKVPDGSECAVTLGNGGDLGTFCRGTHRAAFEAAAFDMKLYDLARPVSTPDGWHLVLRVPTEMGPLTT